LGGPAFNGAVVVRLMYFFFLSIQRLHVMVAEVMRLIMMIAMKVMKRIPDGLVNVTQIDLSGTHSRFCWTTVSSSSLKFLVVSLKATSSGLKTYKESEP
jgi:hypothetical protein